MISRTKIFPLFMFFGICAHAALYDVEVNGIYYNLIKKAKVAEVTYDYNNRYTGDIIIPSSFVYENVEYSVQSIGEDAFMYCKGLNSVIIPEGVTSIEKWAFASSDIKSLVIPNTVTNISEHAFDKCYQLANIVLSNNITALPDGVFFYCTSLESIIIPDNVTEIGQRCFESCESLKKVTLPQNLLTIAQKAFYKCKLLDNVSFPENLLVIGALAFWNCNLHTIVLQGNFAGIGERAFEANANLSKVVLGSNTTYVYDRAFADCQELADVYCFANNVPFIYIDEQWDESKWKGVFYNSQVKYSTLHVPESSINEYKSKPYWKEFGQIVALTEQDTGVSPVDTPAEKTVEKVFSLEGKYMDSPKKGINIIRMSDGTTKKVVIK